MLSSKVLLAESIRLGQPIYWTGPATGMAYEFTRTADDRVYVRYLPWGSAPARLGVQWRIVVTYPFPGAFEALERQAREKAIDGPGGSLIDVAPNSPRSVYMAFPGVPYEIVIYDPDPAVALATAMSGKVRPVG